ncbi:MAG: type II toxin-antitoxin system RelE family toxin [Egibacteraceae bacterium]
MLGCAASHRGDYRVIYEIDGEVHAVVVPRVQHHRDSSG